VSLEWLAGAAVIAAGSFVMGLAGFGIGLVSMAFLPYIMAPATAIVLLTLYALVFAAAIFVPLRRDFTPAAVGALLAGTVLGTLPGVWVLVHVPAPVLDRLIGAGLVVVVALEWAGSFPRRLAGRGWALGVGALAGAMGGAVGLPGPPVIVWSATQGWAPRTVKANIQAFFVVNQAVILAGYWQAGLLTREVWHLAAVFALPALGGVVAGMALFDRVDPIRFRRIVFAVLFAAGAVLLLAG
jgi:uncharacterized protein